MGSDLLFSCDGGERCVPPGFGPHVLGIFLSFSSFLLSAGFGSLSVPLFHKPVTVFLPCSGRLCLMEMEGVMGMNDRVRLEGSRKIITASSCLLCVMTLLISDLDINSVLFCLRDVLV